LCDVGRADGPEVVGGSRCERAGAAKRRSCGKTAAIGAGANDHRRSLLSALCQQTVFHAAKPRFGRLSSPRPASARKHGWRRSGAARWRACSTGSRQWREWQSRAVDIVSWQPRPGCSGGFPERAVMLRCAKSLHPSLLPRCDQSHILSVSRRTGLRILLCDLPNITAYRTPSKCNQAN
jgi:hypothetical protein